MDAAGLCDPHRVGHARRSGGLLKGWQYDSPEAARCFRGLRAATLKKRVADIGPFLRFLRAESGKPVPDELSDILHDFGVRREERAARSVYGTLVNSLAFFEEAGEVPKPLRLSSSAGLIGAAKEFEAKRRLLAESLGESTAKKQAPPLVLAPLEAMEKVVVDESIPLYVRA